MVAVGGRKERVAREPAAGGGASCARASAGEPAVALDRSLGCSLPAPFAAGRTFLLLFVSFKSPFSVTLFCFHVNQSGINIGSNI
jgi:hypothetical protein